MKKLEKRGKIRKIEKYKSIGNQEKKREKRTEVKIKKKKKTREEEGRKRGKSNSAINYRKIYLRTQFFFLKSFKLMKWEKEFPLTSIKKS